MSLKLILTVGVSNSSKTTWAEQYCKDNTNTVNISRDFFRYGMFADSELSSYALEKEVTWAVYREFYSAVREGKSVIISDGNLTPRVRRYWELIAKENKMDLEYVIFQTAFAEKFNSPDVYLLPEYVLGKQHSLFTNFINREMNPDYTYTLV